MYVCYRTSANLFLPLAWIAIARRQLGIWSPTPSANCQERDACLIVWQTCFFFLQWSRASWKLNLPVNRACISWWWNREITVSIDRKPDPLTFLSPSDQLAVAIMFQFVAGNKLLLYYCIIGLFFSWHPKNFLLDARNILAWLVC